LERGRKEEISGGKRRRGGKKKKRNKNFHVVLRPQRRERSFFSKNYLGKNGVGTARGGKKGTGRLIGRSREKGEGRERGMETPWTQEY